MKSPLVNFFRFSKVPKLNKISSGQTEHTQIKLLPEKQFDQGLHLNFNSDICWRYHCKVDPLCLNFRLQRYSEI